MEGIRGRNLTWLVMLGFTLLWAVFAHARAYSANDSSRMAAIESLVERGTWVIDASPFTTIDKIQTDAGFVSDKPPMLAFAGAVVYWPLRHVLGWTLQAGGCTVGCRAIVEGGSADFSYLFLTLLLVALPGALLLGLAYRLAWRNRFPNWVSVTLVTVLALGTSLFAFSTVFTNHVPAAAAVVAGFYLLLMSEAPSAGRLIAVGALAALAVSLDLSTGVYAVGLFALLAWRLRRDVAWFVAGALPLLLLMVGLNVWVAGSVLPPQMLSGGYDYAGSSLYAGFSGFSSADNIPRYAFRMLVGDHGALAFYPVVVWYGYAAVRAWRDGRAAVRHLARVALLATGVYVAYFVFSTDNFGGLAYSPRWMLIPMPLLALFSLLDIGLYRPKIARLAYIALAAVALFSGVRGAFDPWLPAQPVLQLAWTPPDSAEFVNVALSGYARFEDVDPALRETMAFDRVVRRWFDATQALAIPPGDTWWLITAATPPHPDLATPLGLPTRGDITLRTDVTPALDAFVTTQSRAILSSPMLVPTTTPEALVLPQRVADEDGTLALLGYALDDSADSLDLITTWRVEDRSANRPPPHAMFVHLLDESGGIAAQSDGFGVEYGTLLPGDHIVQRHVLNVAGLAGGTYWLQVGVYDPATGARMTTADGADRLLLRGIERQERER